MDPYNKPIEQFQFPFSKSEKVYKFVLHVQSLSLLYQSSAVIFLYTVNSEILARVLFSRNFADAKFRENKPLANGKITVVY